MKTRFNNKDNLDIELLSAKHGGSLDTIPQFLSDSKQAI